MLHDLRLFPVDHATRHIARRLYDSVRDLPILSPHGHTDPAWFALNQPFPNPSALFLQPDHYIFRMLYSQGIPLESLGIPTLNGPLNHDPGEVWRVFARNYYLFRGTPTRLWFDFALTNLFGIRERLSEDNCRDVYDTIDRALQTPGFLPRALFDRFRIEVLATTDSALSNLDHHAAIKASGWPGRILPTFRPDALFDPSSPTFRQDLDTLGSLTGEDTSAWAGFLQALRERRAFFKHHGAAATDHGHATARTADLSPIAAEDLFRRIHAGAFTPEDALLFPAQMLTEMAAMSLDDGLVMQLHPGSVRNHNPAVFKKFGRDMGADIPSPTNFVHDLQPLLAKHGNDHRLTLIVFTLDESTYSRELAPLAGHYPALKLGPPWWFNDSPEGMLRFRQQATETAGFYNTVGFNDDTRAFLSIPGRHDVSRRVDAGFLARLVAEHQIDESEALDLIEDLTVDLVRRAYKL